MIGGDALLARQVRLLCANGRFHPRNVCVLYPTCTITLPKRKIKCITQQQKRMPLQLTQRLCCNTELILRPQDRHTLAV